MDEKELRERLYHAVDTRLSGLEADPWLAERVIAHGRESKNVKKKISVGLVWMIVLMLIAVTALAVAAWRDFAPWIAQTEHDEGDFINWPAEKKQIVIEALAEHEFIEKTEEIQALCEGRLNQDEASRMADEAAKAFVGNENICFMNIMQAAWGPFDDWSDEDRAWYSQVMDDTGVDQSDKTVYAVPAGNVSRDEAAAIARKSVAEACQVDENVLDAYRMTVNYQLPEFREPGDEQPYWYVVLEAPRNMSDKLFSDIELFVHPETGELLETASEILSARKNIPVPPDNQLFREIRTYEEKAKEMGAYTFGEWPLELKAVYSKEITPKVQAIVESGDLTELMNCGQPDMRVVAQSSSIYGIPQNGMMTQEEAFQVASDALAERYAIPHDLFEEYDEIAVYYDVTDEPLWKFVFNPKSLPVEKLKGGYDDPLFQMCYRAEVDAGTGQIVCVEEFPFETGKWTLEYMKKWY